MGKTRKKVRASDLVFTGATDFFVSEASIKFFLECGVFKVHHFLCEKKVGRLLCRVSYEDVREHAQQLREKMPELFDLLIFLDAHRCKEHNVCVTLLWVLRAHGDLRVYLTEKGVKEVKSRHAYDGYSREALQRRRDLGCRNDWVMSLTVCVDSFAHRVRSRDNPNLNPTIPGR